MAMTSSSVTISAGFCRRIPDSGIPDSGPDSLDCKSEASCSDITSVKEVLGAGADGTPHGDFVRTKG
jgi:hypothetical protein